MVWYAWALVGLYALASIGTVLNIGKPRGTLTPRLALTSLISAALCVWGIVSLAT